MKQNRLFKKTPFFAGLLAVAGILSADEPSHAEKGHSSEGDVVGATSLPASSEEGEHHHDHENEVSAPEEDEHDHAHEDKVQVSEEVLREFDIQVAPVRSGELHASIRLPGEIQFNREAFAYVTPRYAAVVQSIKKRLGAKVKKGDELARLENTETLRSFLLKAPFAGTVVDYDLSHGQAVEAGARLFAISDLTTVWADLRVYQRDLYKVREGQSIRIECGYDDTFYAGEIAYIAPTIDEQTRTGLVRVIVDNSNGHWKPGQFIEGIVPVDAHEAELLVPRSAVLTYEGDSVVFVRTAEGFEPQPIQLGRSDAESYEVKSGLQVGDEIVTRNAISLKAELGKASFGGHAGHVH